MGAYPDACRLARRTSSHVIESSGRGTASDFATSIGASDRVGRPSCIGRSIAPCLIDHNHLLFVLIPSAPQSPREPEAAVANLLLHSDSRDRDLFRNRALIATCACRPLYRRSDSAPVLLVELLEKVRVSEQRASLVIFSSSAPRGARPSLARSTSLRPDVRFT